MLTGNGGFGNKPKALMCYICGREYGTASLQIHLKTCMKKWEIQENLKPKKERRPMPQPPKQLSEVLNKINAGGNVNFAELETYNNKANDEWNESALIRCEFCNRTFLPERLGIHRKICTEEKPFKPLPPPNTSGKSNPSTSASTSASTTKGFGGGKAGGNDSYGYRDEQPKSSAMGRGGPGLAKKPNAQPQYEEYNDDDDDNGYVPSKPTAKPQTMSKPSAQPKTQGFGGGGYSNNMGGGEFQDVQLVDCDICGRRFAADRIDRHIKACTKTQKGEAKHAKKVALAEKKQAETEKFIAKEAKYKKNNWREQHKEFVENLKYNRKLKAVEDAGGDIRSLGPAPKMSAIESNMVPCPYCARTFNPQSAEKHINICKNVVNKPKAVPGKPIPSKTTTQAPMRSSQAGGFSGTPSKATPSKNTGSASKYGGTSSYGTYDSLDNEARYNPNNYGGPSSMTNARQTGFKSTMDQPMQKPGLSSQYGAPNSSRGGSTSYGGSASGMGGMNSSSRGGFANVGKMAMQDLNNYNSPPSTKAAKTGYRY